MISILMPVYNSENFLHNSIASIFNQTFFDFEFIIINDASTDSSEKIILSYTDKRIRHYKNEENLGVTATLNKGLKLCKGKYIARMDADDIAMPDRLEKQFRLLEAHPEIGVCGTNMLEFGYSNKTINYPEKHEDIVNEFFFSNPIGHPTVMIRKKILDDFNLQYPDNYLAAEDYQLWVMLQNFTKLYNIQEPLIKYRIHNEQVRSTLALAQSETIKKIQQQLILNYFDNLTEKEKTILISLLENKYKFRIIDLVNVFDKLALKCIDNTNLFNRLLLPIWLRLIIFFPEFSFNNFSSVYRSLLFNKIPLKRKFIFFIKCVLPFQNSRIVW